MIYFARTTLVTNLAIVTTIITVMSIFIATSDFGGRTLAPIEFAKGNLAIVRQVLNLNWITTVVIIFVGAAVILYLHINFSISIYALFFVIWFGLEKCTETIMGLTTANQKYLVLGNSILMRRGLPPFIYYILINTGINSLAALGLALILGTTTGFLHALYYLRKWHMLNRPKIVGVVQAIRNTNHVSQMTIYDQVVNLDVFLIALVGGAFQAGLYSGVIRIINPFYLVSDSAFAAARPIIAVMKDQEKELWKKRIVYIFLSMSGISLFAAAKSGTILNFVLGNQYESAEIYLTLSFLLLPSIISSRGLQSYLMSLGEFRYLERLTKAFFLLSCILLLIMTPIYGTLGIYLGIYSQFILRNFILYRKLTSVLNVELQ
jgi:O-antigen/teichoic acid export membrane protein